MQRLKWTTHSYVLVPETKAEQEELITTLKEQGVRNHTSIDKSGLNGTLEVPESLRWEPDGAIGLSVNLKNQREPVPVWFWLVELQDETTRRFAYWSTQRDLNTANLWQ